MQTAYAYARVSSREQEEKKNSIKEQFERVENFAKKENICILQKFQDSDSAYHDENRVDFATMIDLALKERPNYILLDDSSRFARTRKVAIETKQKLSSYGIKILYASETNVDPNSVMGLWMNGIQEIKNEATSREIAFHTKRGMEGNIQQRDVETGWCYKNGGKAPYGYKRQVLNKGFNNKGKPVFKTIWLLDEEKAPIVRKIIVEMYTENKMSYKQIRDYLNDNGIKNSKGELWSISTIMSMLKEDRLEEYTGTAIWNKENKNVIGVKYNTKDLWTICENAHPAIITREEYQKAMERKGNKNSDKIQKIKTESPYLLTGLNVENEFLFICKECGGHVIGCSCGKKHSKKYTCANNNHKGSKSCNNNWKIEKEWLENRILHIIEEKYIRPNNIEQIVDKLFYELNHLDNTYQQEIVRKQKEVEEFNKQIRNLLNSIKSGVNPTLIASEINHMEEEKQIIVQEIKIIQDKINSKKVQISKIQIKEYISNLQVVFDNATLQEKKELLKTYIHHISFNKKEHQIEISLFQLGFAIMEQVAGIEPA